MIVDQVASKEGTNITAESEVKNQQDKIQIFLRNSSTEISCST